jgi:hypothetical protein
MMMDIRGYNPSACTGDVFRGEDKEFKSFSLTIISSCFSFLKFRKLVGVGQREKM